MVLMPYKALRHQVVFAEEKQVFRLHQDCMLVI